MQAIFGRENRLGKMESVGETKVVKKLFANQFHCLFFVRKKIISLIRVRKTDAKPGRSHDSPNAAVTSPREE
jgi:hypothetical protein